MDYTEFIKQGDELVDLQERLDRLEEENETMRRTIEMILRIKCRRGEGAFSLNVGLTECVQNNVRWALNKADMSGPRAQEAVVAFVVDLLVGPERADIPCAVLDANTLVYKNDDLWIASTLTEFAELVSDMLSEYVMEAKSRTDLTDTQVVFFNSILQIGTFTNILKKALKVYRDL